MADEKLKNDLLRVLKESEEIHSRGQDLAKKASRFMQSGQDEARLAAELVEMDMVNRERMTLLKKSFESRNDGVRVFAGQMTEAISQYSITANVASVAVSTAVSGLASLDEIARYPAVLNRADAVLGYTDELERVRDGLKRCRLDAPLIGENRSALSLVDESATAIQHPPAPDSSAAVVTAT